MKVVALVPFPSEAAATRYRLLQFVPSLRERGIDLTVYPFIDSKGFRSLYHRSEWPKAAMGVARGLVRRLGEVPKARKADVVLVQREAALLGPPLLEWLAIHFGRRPLVLDLDDPTYLSYVSPTYSHLARYLKWPSKTDHLIRWATLVTCGNQAIADYVTAAGTRARVIPTVVDADRFTPRETATPPGEALVVGWIGSHSTYPFLESIAPVLSELAAEHPFRLKVVGSGRSEIRFPGVEIENLPWLLDREVEDFRGLDVGLYPIVADQWSTGKSGLKAIQYMAVGVPFVVSPVGATAEIGEAGVTHLCASSHEAWKASLGRLLADRALRHQMGEAGRRHVLEHYSLTSCAEALADALSEAASG